VESQEDTDLEQSPGRYKPTEGVGMTIERRQPDEAKVREALHSAREIGLLGIDLAEEVLGAFDALAVVVARLRKAERFKPGDRVRVHGEGPGTIMSREFLVRLDHNGREHYFRQGYVAVLSDESREEDAKGCGATTPPADLIETLRERGKHDRVLCRIMADGRGPCTCGLDDALAAVVAERDVLRSALGAYRSALRSGEPESDQLCALGDSALSSVGSSRQERGDG
jgi:hypothetical protein